MPDKRAGVSSSISRPKSVKIGGPGSHSNQPNTSKGGLTLLALGTVLFLILFVPVEGPLYACLLPLIVLFAIKDILNIPTKIFTIILICLGVLLGFQFINAMRGFGMY